MGSFALGFCLALSLIRIDFHISIIFALALLTQKTYPNLTTLSQSSKCHYTLGICTDLLYAGTDKEALAAECKTM